MMAWDTGQFSDGSYETSVGTQFGRVWHKTTGEVTAGRHG